MALQVQLEELMRWYALYPGFVSVAVSLAALSTNARAERANAAHVQFRNGAGEVAFTSSGDPEEVRALVQIAQAPEAWNPNSLTSTRFIATANGSIAEGEDKKLEIAPVVTYRLQSYWVNGVEYVLPPSKTLVNETRYPGESVEGLPAAAGQASSQRAN